MIVRLRAVANRDQARDALRQVETNAVNIRGAGHTGADMLTAYLQWASESVRLLRHQISVADIDRLVLTKRYWSLQGSTEATFALLSLLVGMEIDERIDDLRGAGEEIDLLSKRWPHGHLIVPDTSALIHGPKVWEWDPAAEFRLGEVPVHIVVPILVLDELDGLKEHNKEHTRSRARRTLNWLSTNLQGDSMRDRERRVGGPDPHGAVVLHVFDDASGHRRLPIADDEIVDRAEVIAATAGRPVTLFTNDYSQAYRAKRVGLLTAMVADPIYDFEIKEAAQKKAQIDKRARQEERPKRSSAST